jgi:hypothetical protein
VANENTYTMHQPFVALAAGAAAAGAPALQLPAPGSAERSVRCRRCGPRLRNSLPFFGNDWIKSGGIGEFTGGGINGCGRLPRRAGAPKTTR